MADFRGFEAEQRAALAEMQRKVDEVHAALAGIRVRASSRNGELGVTVDAQGHVQHIQLTTRALGLGEKRLAHVLLETIQHAEADAARQARQARDRRCSHRPPKLCCCWRDCHERCSAGTYRDWHQRPHPGQPMERKQARTADRALDYRPVRRSLTRPLHQTIYISCLRFDEGGVLSVAACFEFRSLGDERWFECQGGELWREPCVDIRAWVGLVHRGQELVDRYHRFCEPCGQEAGQRGLCHEVGVAAMAVPGIHELRQWCRSVGFEGVSAEVEQVEGKGLLLKKVEAFEQARHEVAAEDGVVFEDHGVGGFGLFASMFPAGQMR